MSDFFTRTFGFTESDYASTVSRLMRMARFLPAAPEDMITIPTLPVPAERCEFDTPRGVASAGVFYEPSLQELRDQVARVLADPTLRAAVDAQATAAREKSGALIRVRNLVGESRALHSHPMMRYAVFQAASQFNYLEFPGPSVTPEQGIAGYEYDRTQGPACAIACAAGTAYRNYLLQPLPEWAPTKTDRGQTKPFQRNGLAASERELLKAMKLAAPDVETADKATLPWIVRNGYIEASPQRLPAANEIIASAAVRSEMMKQLRVGVQQDAMVFHANGTPVHPVTQVYCSAVSCGYSRCPTAYWTPLATLVLESAYEATLLCGIMNVLRCLKHPELVTPAVAIPPVLLTKVGGGVFGNERVWIQRAISRAVAEVARYGVPLDIRVVHYGGVEDGYEDETVRNWSV